MEAGLIVLYQWSIAEEHAAAFAECWRGATENLKEHGALGSLLAKAEDGTLWAIARWPDRQTREQAEVNYIDNADWPPVQRLQTTLLEPLENRWS